MTGRLDRSLIVKEYIDTVEQIQTTLKKMTVSEDKHPYLEFVDQMARLDVLAKLGSKLVSIGRAWVGIEGKNLKEIEELSVKLQEAHQAARETLRKDLSLEETTFRVTAIPSVVMEIMQVVGANLAFGATERSHVEAKRAPNAEEDLKKITAELSEKLQSEIIPEDIKTKAKEMSEVYLYTYCAENSLRAFIETVATKNYGADLSKLKLNRDMKNKIEDRKKSHEKKKWLGARGGSDIFYLDIEDLAKLIANNWDIFKQYFDSLEWIAANIKEIADCRNPVAHHCYLREHERDIVRIDFIKILKQISETLK